MKLVSWLGLAWLGTCDGPLDVCMRLSFGDHSIKFEMLMIVATPTRRTGRDTYGFNK